MPELPRKLGLLEVFCIASGAMVSSGLFVLPGLAHAKAGPAVIFSYFFAGILASSAMLSVAEILTAMPKAGGDYFFITRTMGSAAGTVAGLLSWFSLTMKSSFALMGISIFLAPLTNWNPLLIAITICSIFIILNIVGVKKAVNFQIFLVLVLLLLMVIYIVEGMKAINFGFFVPFVPNGWNPVFSTAGFVFISYGGLLTVAAVAEEVKDPGKVIPLGMILSLVTIVVFYTLMVFVTSGVLGSEQLDTSLMPISAGAQVFLGDMGMKGMSVAAILAFVSTANGEIISASRYLLSLSRDEFVPSFLGQTNTKFQTPHSAIIITGACVAGALFLPQETLVKAASTVVILTCILANLCVVVLRESNLLNYQPIFRAPFIPGVNFWVQLAMAYYSWKWEQRLY
jgi:amino acid transporter